MKYITRPRSYYSYDLDEEIINETITVHEEDSSPEPTGLLDRHGNEVFRVNCKQKIGFGLKR